MNRDIENLGFLLDNLKINFYCLQFLHLSFNNKRKELGEYNFLLLIRKRQIQYLRFCYLNHFSEIVSLLNTLIFPTKNEISLKYLNKNIIKNDEFLKIKKNFKDLHLERNEFISHKDVKKNHNFLNKLMSDYQVEHFDKLQEIVDNLISYCSKMYKGRIKSYANLKGILCGLKKIYQETDKKFLKKSN